MSSIVKEMKTTGKLLHYVLGRCPDEFGLLPDDNGFVSIKALLGAVSASPTGRAIRMGTLNQLVAGLKNPPIEICGKQIRAVDRSHLPKIAPAKNPPKLLYAAIRQRAHRSAMQKGLISGAHAHIILWPTQEKARRMSHQRHPGPVVLTIHVSAALERHIVFYRYGEQMYLTACLPADVLSGPPVAPEPEPRKGADPQKPTVAKTPGSFFPDLAINGPPPAKKTTSKKRRQEVEWKKNRRLDRRRKR